MWGKKIIHRLLIACLLYPFCIFAEDLPHPSEQATITAENITYYTENYPPASYYENGELIGLSVETLKLMWRHMGLEPQSIQVVPWARGYQNTISAPGTMLFSTARTLERESLFKWVGPIFSAQSVLFSRADFEGDINTIEDAYVFKTAAVRGDITYTVLIEAGYPESNIEKVTQLKQAILMLKNKRVDFLILTRDEVFDPLQWFGFEPKEFKKVLQVNATKSYFAFNKETPDSLIEDFQSSFDATTSARLPLYEKYQVGIPAIATHQEPAEQVHEPLTPKSPQS